MPDTFLERRSYNADELRAATGDGEKHPHIVGHAAVFNSLSEPIWGMFRERIEPGAFKETLKTSDVRALLNHDPNYVLGRNKNSTLRLWEDGAGLAVDINPPGTQWANDLLVSIDRGDINQMSFGFIVGEDKWTEEDGLTVRTIMRVDRLFDVSPVTFPAYPETDTSLRDLFAEKVKTLSLINKNPVIQADAGLIAQPAQARDLAWYKRRLRLIELSAALK